jgi:hypothetical protein
MYSSGPVPILTSDALAQGIPRRLVQSRFRPIFHGVRVHGELPMTLAATCEAASMILPDHCTFSHLTAVQLLDLPTPFGFKDDATVHVSIPVRANRIRRREIAAHRSGVPDAEIIDIDGLPVTRPERAFVDLAAHFDATYLVPLDDAMLRRGLATVASLGEAIETAAGRRGVAAARRALPRLDSRSKSPSESLLRVRIEDAGMPKLEPNVDVFDSLGCWIATPDLLAAAAKVAVEHEGDHHREKRQFARDIARDQLVQGEGYVVLRTYRNDLFRTTPFYSTLRGLLDERTPRQ